MSYADQAAISTDPEFRGRLTAATQREARSKDDALARDLLTGNQFAADRFLPWVTTEPGFDVPDQSTITDGQLLSAVQLVWPDVLAANYPAAA